MDVQFMSQGPVQDEVIAKLRSAFLEIVREYKVYTEGEKKEVISAPLNYLENSSFNLN